jgi:hypothetical protein
MGSLAVPRMPNTAKAIIKAKPDASTGRFFRQRRWKTQIHIYLQMILFIKQLEEGFQITRFDYRSFLNHWGDVQSSLR